MVKKVYEQPEIWRIDIALPQNPLRNLNAYVLRSEGESMIIDTGFCRPECREALWSGIDELRLDIRHTSLFLTHLHSDHIGLVQDFVDRGCPIYMSHIDYEYFCRIKAGEVWPYMEELFRKEGFPADELPRQATENQGRRYAPQCVFPANLLQDGKVLKIGNIAAVCVHTPGHTPGHMVIYLPDEQILFSGDHILFDITPNISVWKDTPHSLADYLGSLEKIAKLPIRITFPAHRTGDQNVRNRIQEIFQHHMQRLEEICCAVGTRKGQDAHAIAAQIRWAARGRTWEQFPPHQKWFAVGETLAHLYYLVDEGRIIRQTDGLHIRYELAERSLSQKYY